jgi:hypothetical protein
VLQEPTKTGLRDNMCALIPRLRIPLRMNAAAPVADDVVFDLLEYTSRRVVGIRSRKFHSYWRHDDLTFDRSIGLAEFRAEVNDILARGGVALEMDNDGAIRRMGSRELHQAVERLPISGTGDAELETLFEQSRRYYFSRRTDERQIALEKLWDAFERIKTVDTNGDKKIGIPAILSACAKRVDVLAVLAASQRGSRCRACRCLERERLGAVVSSIGVGTLKGARARRPCPRGTYRIPVGDLDESSTG